MSKRNSRARQLLNACKIQAKKHNNISYTQQLTTTTHLELLINNDNFENKSSIEKLQDLLKILKSLH